MCRHIVLGECKICCLLSVPLTSLEVSTITTWRLHMLKKAGAGVSGEGPRVQAA